MEQEISCQERLEQSLLDIVVESWRFSKLFARLLQKLDSGEGDRYSNQFRYYQKKIEESLEASGMRLVNVETQQYDIGMAATVLNLGDFEPTDQLVVEQMIEPIIMGSDGLLRTGTVTLKRAGT